MKPKPGDPAPKSYLDWHEWATVQHKAGLRQKKCEACSLYKYPQELSGDETKPVCIDCKAKKDPKTPCHTLDL